MKRTALLTLVIGIVISACNKDNTPNNPPGYSVPTTYNFTGVDYSDQRKIIAMADQLVAEINLANTPNTAVSAQRLANLFTNSNNPFNDSTLQLNSSGLKLADLFPPAAKVAMLNYLDSVTVFSQSNVAASPGVAGVAASSVSPSKKLLLSPTGVFYSQVIKKTIMGMCAYQIVSVYLTDSLNNATDPAKLGHYWDAAFGFFGVPVDFPANTNGLKYLGSYSNQVNAGLGSNARIMGAFLIGRAAISNSDINTMKLEAQLLVRTFDSLNAACIVQEMHETNENLEAGDAISAYGTLSESLGFVYNFSFMSNTKVITDGAYVHLLQLYDAPHPSQPDLYKFVGSAGGLTTSQIEEQTEEIEDFIGQTYGFTAAQLSLL